MKKNFYLIIAIILLIPLTGCMVGTYSQEEKHADPSTPMLKPEDVLYYNSVEEAVAHNNLDTFNTKHIGEQIKLFRHDNIAVLFFKTNEFNKDAIYMLKFYIKESGGTQFSSPISGSNIQWEAHKAAVRMNNCDETGEIRLCIELLNTSQVFNVDNTKTFVWGVSQTENVNDLEIEGQSATEVIEVELDGEVGYFWYFDDLETEKPLAFEDIRKYTHGELIITIPA